MAVGAMCFAVLVVVVVAGTLIRHNTCFILAIAAGVFLLAGAGALVFGRRLSATATSARRISSSAAPRISRASTSGRPTALEQSSSRIACPDQRQATLEETLSRAQE